MDEQSLSEFERGIAAYFDRLAPSYGQGVYYARRRSTLIGRMEPELRPGASVLDLGCGNGTYLAAFGILENVGSLHGIDLSLEMVREAKRRMAGRAHLVQAEVCALPYRAQSFDLVLASHVLPFAYELGLAVLDIARVLKPGGLLVATLGGGSARGALRALMAPEQWAEFEKSAFDHSLTRRIDRGPERYLAAGRAAGLQVETQTLTFRLTWRDVAEWLRIRWVGIASGREIAQRIADEVLAPRLDQEVEVRQSVMLARKPVG